MSNEECKRADAELTAKLRADAELTAKLRADAELTAKPAAVQRGHHGRYGAPRMHAELRKQGIGVSRK